jgi:phage tail protein X
MTQTANAMDGETVDEICHRVLGKTAAVTEQVLDLNPGLAELGPRLPGGTWSPCPTPAPPRPPPSISCSFGIEA